MCKADQGPHNKKGRSEAVPFLPMCLGGSCIVPVVVEAWATERV